MKLVARIDACNTSHGQLALSGKQSPLLEQAPFQSIALSRNGGYAAAADASGAVTVLDTHTRRAIVYRLRGIRLATPAFGADEHRVLFVASDGTIRSASTTRHDLSTPVKRLPGQTEGLAVADDGRLMAVYGEAATIELLDRTGRNIGAVPGGDAIDAAFSPSGDRLAIAYGDGMVRIWATGPDLMLDRPQLTPNKSDSTLVGVVRNLGTSRSSATLVESGTARQKIPALDPGASVGVRLTIPTPDPGIPALVRIHPSRSGEQSEVDNDRWVWTSGDARAQIVAAALTGASHGGQVHHATLQPQAFQGILHEVRLPDVPRTANSSMFATWCYWQAGVADPNHTGYQTASDAALRFYGSPPQKLRPRQPLRPGDIVFYPLDPAHDPKVAIYVGGRRVVRWIGGRLTVRPLGHPDTTRTYPMDRVAS